jgi:hypothetical protein
VNFYFVEKAERPLGSQEGLPPLDSVIVTLT